VLAADPEGTILSDGPVSLNLAAVVLTLGADTTFQHVVADLVAQGLTPERICVVHNRVSPNEPSADPRNLAVGVIELEGNLGYSGGMNEGLTHQISNGAEWIWVLTQDVRLRRHALVELTKGAVRAERYGALGPVVFDNVTGNVFSRGGVLGSTGGLYHKVGEQQTEDHVDVESGAISSAQWLDGSSILFRVEALASVGLYDERFHSYCEDVEICWRLRRQGWKVGVVATSEIAQSIGRSRRPGIYSYLMTRNSLFCRHLMVGRSGVVRGIAECLWLVLYATKRMLVAGRDQEERRTQWALAVGTLLGIAAYLARRRGPPPRWIPGRGDLKPD
jgi:GT2 family glycosyltransferase